VPLSGRDLPAAYITGQVLRVDGGMIDELSQPIDGCPSLRGRAANTVASNFSRRLRTSLSPETPDRT